MTIKAKKSKINLREKLAELLNFRQIRDRLDGLGLYLGKDRTGTAENLAVRGGANVDDLQLAEISAALGGAAVDVFVYDTRNDSDGGKWRERTQHTSWYNEELNTATRGSRREFPAVAVIVAEAGKVTIYDGDDPDLSMWMVFDDDNAGADVTYVGVGNNIQAVSALNGRMSVGCSIYGIFTTNFIADECIRVNTTYFFSLTENTAGRNNASGLIHLGGDPVVNGSVNDVAMTVLPNSTIDSETGLPVPTIAVATDGGVSVIKHDGNVVDITCSNVSFKYSYYVVFDQLNRLFFSLDGLNNSRRIWGLNDIPTDENFVVTADINEKQNGDIFIADDNGFGTATKDMFLFNQSNPHAMGFTSDNSIGTNKNLFKSFINQEDSGKSLHNYITSTYNTGWMCGDIKLATLSDTKIEKVGVDESTELVTNGTFNSNTTGWNLYTGVGSITRSEDGGVFPDGAIKIVVGSGSQAPVARQTITGLQVGKIYIVSADVYVPSANQCDFAVVSVDNPAPGASGSLETWAQTTTVDTVHNISFVFEATDANATVFLSVLNATVQWGSAGDLAHFDNISVKQTGELITNGTFDNGIEGWTDASSDWSALSGQASSSGNGSLTQAITTIVGETYTISIDAVTIVSPYVRVVVSGAVPVQLDVGYTGTKAGTFTATSTSTTIQINPYTSGQTIDNISVRLAEDDRSVNNNGLQVFGEIDKTPVATGADLVAYSGFSADDYLMQPYNSDLDFGTGDFCVMGWFKGTSTNGTILDRASTDASLGRTLILFSTNLEFKTIFNGATITCASNKSISDNTWHYFSAVRRDGKLSIYIDGFLSSPEEDSTHDVSNPSAYLNIGLRYNLTGPLGSGNYLALLRVGATAPTADQIAKIYRDEKSLFTDGAQATLYGTSDAVTALAYDDKTELLHVGTSSGRSDFAELRRINNTTIPVTTSISASNNLIAEQ